MGSASWSSAFSVPGEKGPTTESFAGIEIPLMTIMGSNDIAARG